MKNKVIIKDYLLEEYFKKHKKIPKNSIIFLTFDKKLGITTFKVKK